MRPHNLLFIFGSVWFHFSVPLNHWSTFELFWSFTFSFFMISIEYNGQWGFNIRTRLHIKWSINVNECMWQSIFSLVQLNSWGNHSPRTSLGIFGSMWFIRYVDSTNIIFMGFYQKQNASSASRVVMILLILSRHSMLERAYSLNHPSLSKNL